MTKRSDFKLHDQAEHVTMGRGTVSKAGDEYVVISYRNGGSGEYDDRWFEMYPEHLKRYADHQN